jgi:hypothetical protein
MLKLILDHDFVRTPPAVDTSSYSHHGTVQNVRHSADGVAPGSGALRFGDAGGRVRIASRPAWQRLGPLAVEATIMLRSSSGRRNIVEGDGSFTLYVDEDDTLVGSVFALADGSASPDWHRVSSGPNSPAGAPRKVPLDTWCRVLFHHDGYTRARLFLNAELVATRNDYRSGPGPVGGAGVVIGNWTLANQFEFEGLIDRVRIFKQDERELFRKFRRRGGGALRDYWDDIGSCLAETLRRKPPEQSTGFALGCQVFLGDILRALQLADGDERVRILEALEAYQRNWRTNNIDDPSQVLALKTIGEFLYFRLGAEWIDKFREFTKQVSSFLEDTAICFDHKTLPEADPEFVRLIEKCIPVFTSENMNPVVTP